MITINLLPEELKAQRSKRLREQKFPLTLILLSTDIILIAVLLIVSGVNLARNATLKALESRLQGLAPEQQKIMKVMQKTTDLKTTNAFFEEITSTDVNWSQKLNILSELLVPGIWFREITVKEQIAGPVVHGSKEPPKVDHYLKVSAVVVSVAHDEMGVIGAFMRELKANNLFNAHFKNIELESVLRRSIADVEVMDFNVLCYFKDEVKL